VALRALGLEDLGAGGRVAGGSLGEGRHRRRTQAETRRRRGNSRGKGQVKLLLALLAISWGLCCIGRSDGGEGRGSTMLPLGSKQNRLVGEGWFGDNGRFEKVSLSWRKRKERRRRMRVDGKRQSVDTKRSARCSGHPPLGLGLSVDRVSVFLSAPSTRVVR
jgi:hypothetical protein